MKLVQLGLIQEMKHVIFKIVLTLVLNVHPLNAFNAIKV